MGKKSMTLVAYSPDPGVFSTPTFKFLEVANLFSIL